MTRPCLFLCAWWFLGACSSVANNALDLGGLTDASEGTQDMTVLYESPVGTVFAHTTTSLYRVDPATFDIALIGDFSGLDASGEVIDIAITPGGQLYALSVEALYRVDPHTANVELIAGGFTSSPNVGMTFHPDGRLICVDKDGKVRLVNPMTGAIMKVGAYGIGLTNHGDLVSVAGGTIFGTSISTPTSTDSFVSVDAATGRATTIGPTGRHDVFGLSYSEGRALGFTYGGEIFQIDPTSGATTSLRTHTDVNFMGAASSPLVPLS